MNAINRLIAKSLLIWAMMIPQAVLNGALREFLLIPLLDAAAYPVSGLILCGLLFLMVSLLLPRLGRGRKSTYIIMGLVWVACTVVFETLLGLLSGASWAEILGSYNPTTGNLWLLVVLFFGVTPWWVARRKELY